MISSLDNSRVKEVIRLRGSRERSRTGLLVAEGVREVERALSAGLLIRSIYHAPDVLPGWTPAAAQSPSHTRDGGCRRTGPEQTHAAGARFAPEAALVHEVTPRVLAKMAYRSEPEGVIGVFAAPEHALPVAPTLVLVAVGIEKPGNLGAMARTADAAGADALLTSDGRTDPWNPNAIRASTGAVFSLPLVEVTREDVAALPLQRIAAVVGAAQSHTGPDYTRPTAFIVGAEDVGLDDDWRSVADTEVEIPMRGVTADSLNAGAAAAVLLYEAVRQRAERRVG